MTKELPLLTDEQMRLAVVHELAKHGLSDKEWRNFTYERGPDQSSITTLRVLTSAICRAVELAVRAQLQAEQPKQEPLTEEQIRSATGYSRYCPSWTLVYSVVRAIERAHGIGAKGDGNAL